LAASAIIPEKCAGGAKERQPWWIRGRATKPHGGGLGEGEHGWCTLPSQGGLKDVQELPRPL